MKQAPPDELQQLRAQIYALGKKKRTAGLSEKESREMDRLGAQVGKLIADKVGEARGE